MTIARKRHHSSLCVFCLGAILLWALLGRGGKTG